MGAGAQSCFRYSIFYKSHLCTNLSQFYCISCQIHTSSTLIFLDHAPKNIICTLIRKIALEYIGPANLSKVLFEFSSDHSSLAAIIPVGSWTVVISLPALHAPLTQKLARTTFSPCDKSMCQLKLLKWNQSILSICKIQVFILLFQVFFFFF